MSANPITANDVVKYISQILNIDISDRLTFEDMLEDLKSISDLAKFRVFMKERFNYERFRYLTGYQKFIALVNEFKKENAPKLTAEQDFKVRSFTENLFSKVCTVFDQINWEVQAGVDIYDKKISIALFKVFGENKKELEVLEAIGNRVELLRLIRTKEVLKQKIKEIVAKKTLLAHYPQLENKTSKTIFRLQNRNKK